MSVVEVPQMTSPHQSGLELFPRVLIKSPQLLASCI